MYKFKKIIVFTHVFIRRHYKEQKENYPILEGFIMTKEIQKTVYQLPKPDAGWRLLDIQMFA
ncbi:hypothetical protein [Lysinibacillus xylanilyticus]|uniref:hypothetical protein n=1 Tax=Lysinibacillus xylanilyticus TaxID=582475 RepID=UPI0037FD16EE